MKGPQTPSRYYSLVVASAFALAAASAAQATTVTATFTSAVGGFWSNLADWSPSAPAYPSNGNNGVSDYNIVIASPNTTDVDVSPTIDNLTVNSGATFDTDLGTTFTINGPLITNNGHFFVDASSDATPTALIINANCTLTGNGFMVLSNTHCELDTSAGVTLTQDVNHSIAFIGTINAALINNGVVNANLATSSKLILQTNNKTNNNLFEATRGILAINGITITQGPSGQILASLGNVTLSNTTINGGALNSAANGTIQILSGNNTLTLAINNNGTLNILGGATLTDTSTSFPITDNGNITINSNNANATTALSLYSTLTGNGTFTLNSNGNSTTAQLNGNFTQDTSHSITGHGAITANITNNGTVNATAGTMAFSGSMINNNLLEATTGTLLINNANLSQGPNGQIYANGGAVNLANTSITSGTLNASGAGTFSFSGSSVLNSITNNAPINNVGNLVLQGNLTTNNNTITNTGNLTFANTNVSGTGSIVLNGGVANGTLTLSADQTLSGSGFANFSTLTNNGTILANGSLSLFNNVTNNGLIHVTTGGGLFLFPSCVLTTTPGSTIEVDPNSSFSSNNSPLTNNGNIVLNGFLAQLLNFSALNNIGNLTINDGYVHFQGPITGPGNISVSGSDALVGLTGVSGNLSITAGRIFISSTSTSTSRLSGLTFGGTTGAWTGLLSLANNKLIVEATPATKTALLASLQDQVYFGKTHNAGITSNTTLPFTLALLDNAVTQFSTFAGQPVDANSLLIAPELPGDANADGTVNLTDLSTVLNNFGTTTGAWTSGNFDGQATINLTDLSDVLNNFGQTNPNPSASEFITHNSELPAPEPATCALLLPRRPPPPLPPPPYERRRAAALHAHRSITITDASTSPTSFPSAISTP